MRTCPLHSRALFPVYYSSCDIAMLILLPRYPEEPNSSVGRLNWIHFSNLAPAWCWLTPRIIIIFAECVDELWTRTVASAPWSLSEVDHAPFPREGGAIGALRSFLYKEKSGSYLYTRTVMSSLITPLLVPSSEAIINYKKRTWSSWQPPLVCGLWFSNLEFSILSRLCCHFVCSHDYSSPASGHTLLCGRFDSIWLLMLNYHHAVLKKTGK